MASLRSGPPRYDAASNLLAWNPYGYVYGGGGQLPDAGLRRPVRPEPDVEGQPGAITRLDLPTAGRLVWSYRNYLYPTLDPGDRYNKIVEQSERGRARQRHRRRRTHRHLLHSVRRVTVEGLNEFEQAVLEKLLAGDHPVLAVLRVQAQGARLASREYSGAGFFLAFDVPPDAPVLEPRDFHFGDVNAAVDGLQFGAGFVVFVRGGRLDALEGYSYEEPWPDEILGFKLSYQREPRDLSLPDATTMT